MLILGGGLQVPQATPPAAGRRGTRRGRAGACVSLWPTLPPCLTATGEPPMTND